MKVCVVNNTAAHYREAVYRLIDLEWDTQFLLGDIDSVKKLDIKSLKSARLVGYKTFIHKPFYYLKDTISLLWKGDTDVLLMCGESYCVSLWAMLLLRPLISPRKRVYLWTHGWYGREGWLKRFVLKFRTRLCTGVFTYGDRAREEAIMQGNPVQKIHAIHNSLDHKAQLAVRNVLSEFDCLREHFGNEYPILAFIGRLTPVKRLDLIIEAMSLLCQRGLRYNLVVLGEGSERVLLERLTENLGLTDYVWFKGECYNEHEIAEVIGRSDLCVSPGNVGLTAIHAMTYGTPVITHNDFTHQMPEVETVREGQTGLFFTRDDAVSLADAIESWFSQPGYNREAVRQNCYKEIDERWNPEFQLNVLRQYMK